MKTRHAVTVCVCLLLLALLVWRLKGYGFNLSHLSGASDLVDNTPLLDSFSEPSVGLAVLKQEAERLMSNYSQNRNEVEMYRSTQLSDSAATGTKEVAGSVSSWLAAVNSAAAQEDSALKRLEKLRTDVQELEVDLDWKLMTAYSQNDSCNEFLDCYLRLVHQAPERPWVLFWRKYALECARNCGRAEEVTDALRHLLRFQQNLFSARERRALLKMRVALEKWEADISPVPEVSKR
jgi:hypothetical protein